MFYFKMFQTISAVQIRFPHKIINMKTTSMALYKSVVFTELTS